MPGTRPRSATDGMILELTAIFQKVLEWYAPSGASARTLRVPR